MTAAVPRDATTSGHRAIGKTLPLALLIATALVGACSQAPPPAQPAASATAEPAPPAPAKPVSSANIVPSDARISLVNNNGQLRYDGQVDNEATAKRIVAALSGTHAQSRLSGHLATEPGTRPASWQDNLGAFAADFDVSGAAVSFEADRIVLSGQVAQADRRRLLERARVLFPKHRYLGLFEGLDADAAPPSGPARALADFKPGGSEVELLMALNQSSIGFARESAQIDASSLDLVSRAATALKAAPGDARIEISGPVDDTGDNERDLALSKQRADALKAQLIINGVNPAAIETRGRTRATADKASSPHQGNLGFRLLSQ
ncbi:OmpA family protein [Montanilutibacter psychrotolerans]|uniref:OmpA-like domain-containing protein n=1 Tax=Montanilutibacter psychrotolerans TaxID=1327343 RepID=A0A3M8T050_9GAMM|nr:OmpA family protein [Lysobacter psychrotolerans]RNF85066.1 hypothetical protein EER27_04575 [Lysobacter psychrotolerans]